MSLNGPHVCNINGKIILDNCSQAFIFLMGVSFFIYHFKTCHHGIWGP